MRFPQLAVIAAAAVALAFASLPFALAADPPAPSLVRQAFLPGVAGDDASGFGLPATATPPATSTPAAPLDTCAGERSPVKTLTDSAAAFDRTPAASSIFALQALERPTVGPATPRLAPTETGVIELNVWLRGFIRRNSGAIELLVSNSPTGPIMMANFPPQGCIAKAAPGDQAAMTTARIDLINRCGIPITGGITDIAGPAKLRAVPFWGTPRLDGTTGAPSGIELGPVLAFEMAQGLDCDPETYKDGIPTPTPVPVPNSITINITPQTAARGTTIAVTIFTQPAMSGVSCSYVAWDIGLEQMASGEAKLTGPDGTAAWQFTIPADAATGTDGRVTPSCAGVNTTGSARLTILP
jgi:hypothetical protein